MEKITKSWENQVQTSKGFSMESYRMHLTSLATSYDNMCKVLLPGRFITKQAAFLLEACLTSYTLFS